MSAPSATDHPARHTNGRFGPGHPGGRAALVEPDGVLVDHANADSDALRAPHLRCLTVRRGPNHASAAPAPSTHRTPHLRCLTVRRGATAAPHSAEAPYPGFAGTSPSGGRLALRFSPPWGSLGGSPPEGRLGGGGGRGPLLLAGRRRGRAAPPTPPRTSSRPPRRALADAHKGAPEVRIPKIFRHPRA